MTALWNVTNFETLQRGGYSRISKMARARTRWGDPGREQDTRFGSVCGSGVAEVGEVFAVAGMPIVRIRWWTLCGGAVVASGG